MVAENKYLSIETMEAGKRVTLAVGGGLGGKSWATYKQREGSRGHHRLTSPLCPVRETPEEAEADLAAYCAMRLGCTGPLYELVRRYQARIRELEGQLGDVRRCRVCGCTDEYGCDEGCYWVEEDLCSACVGKEGGL